MTQGELKLEIITQERKLLNVVVNQVIVVTESGEITILPGHIGLFTQLREGLLKYLEKGVEHTVAVFGGFMDVSPEGVVTILADAADRAEELDLREIEKAKAQASAVLADKHSTPIDYQLAETALRQMYLKERAARTHRTGTQKNV